MGIIDSKDIECTDNDGLSDELEAALGTDPAKPDSGVANLKK
jgi:hypothetical protein